MSYEKKVPSYSKNQNFFLDLKPVPAWTAILGLAGFTLLCILTGVSKILLLAFPFGALCVSIFLYFRYPTLYLGFTWWIWFVAPLISRIVEYQNRLADPGMRPIILAPYLVTTVTIITFFRHMPKLYKKEGTPFILAFVAIAYALLVGLVRGNPTVQVIQRLLSWLPGVCFGFHLLVDWRAYPEYRQNTQRNFYWAVLIMGIYGTIQYLYPIRWDQYWLSNSENLLNCCGWPDPWNIRVWSTLNYPFTFAYSMMAGLLISLNQQDTKKSVISTIAGFIALLLSRVRGAWGAFFLGFLCLIFTLNSRLKKRLITTVLAIFLCISPVVFVGPLSSSINSRLETLSNVQDDNSLEARTDIYRERLNTVLSEFIGQGMGAKKLEDTGILDVGYTLGWVGMASYMGGALLSFIRLFRYKQANSDTFMNAARSIPLSIFASLLFTNSLILLPGVLFWGFSGMAMAANRYYYHQNQAKN